MKSRLKVVKRAAAVLLSAGFLFVMVGDRAMTATPLGIDPLEVLNLQIKPNVLIVLDTSGSMNETVVQNGIGGDSLDSKLGSAKSVMRTVLVNNESKVNMMFGTYTNTGSRFTRTGVQANSGNQDHFGYWAKSSDFPSMLTTQLTANQTYAFQIIGNGIAPNGRTNNNLLYYTEENGGTDAVCTATLTPRFYQSGGQLATEMAARMNAATCTGTARVNTYTVTWSGTAFTFTRAGARQFRMNWNTATNSVRAVLGGGTAVTGNNTTHTTGDARFRILRRINGDGFTEGTPSVTFYEMVVGRFFNGEKFYVQTNGNVCDMTAGPPSTTRPFVDLQLITGTTCPAPGGSYGSATGTLSGTPVTFQGDGGAWGGNSNSCGGFQLRTQLRACDNTAGQALAINTPFLEPAWQIATAPGAAPAAGIIGVVPGGLVNREETLEGVGRFDTTGGNILPYGLAGDGSTPIGNSLRDLKPVFTRYYNGGGTIPATVGPVTVPTSGSISLHVQPRERTIVLFITDGDDTCSGSGDAAARSAAGQAQNLYDPIVGGVQNPSGQFTVGTDPASSVTTYVIGYGNATTPIRMNMIAWGGSGMQYNFGSGVNPSAADRLLCQTCQDAQIAPTPAALEAILQAIFDQGAQTGEFTAQQSITGSIYEYVDQAPSTAPARPFDARNPDNRYSAFTPVKFVSTFTLPGFNGQLKAYSNACNAPSGTPGVFQDAATGATCAAGDDSVLLWSAGDKLLSAVTAGMRNATGCPIASSPGAVDGECRFDQLHAGATDASIATSSAAIKRRIYTTSQNGYFGVSIANLLAGAAPYRISLWPPQATVAPAVAPASLAQALFDQAMGLPLDGAASPATEFTNLQTRFRVCQNPGAAPLPTSTARTNCLSGTPLVRMQQARREAREIILSFMAGATPVIDSQANPKRVASGANAGLILYRPKPWVLGESSLATPAEVPPPFGSPSATPYTAEYDFFKEGGRVGGVNTGLGDNTVAKGFGLASPDRDSAAKDPTTGQDARAIKPVMSVLYAGANDMLHAFRAGSRHPLNFNRTGGLCGNQIVVTGQKQMSSALSAAVPDCGGDELWGFVPFDQLSKLYSRALNNPARRDPHDYMIARGLRFADVFVPGSTDVDFGNGTQTLQGVWRKVLYIPRGIGGKYMTAIDVTAPGTFQTPFLTTMGPIPLWSRGNPDTTNGVLGGPAVNTTIDTDAYAQMGQTWSLPAVVFVEKTENLTARRPGGVDFVAYMGSGYGTAPGEGTRIYTLDALTGDVVAAPDVEPVATANGLSRGPRSAPGTPPVAYDNAIVANVVAFNPSNYKVNTTAHPSASKTSRVYVGDLYGRFWKLLSARPDTPLPMADLEDGADHQPVATAASIVGLPLDQVAPAPTPYVYVTSGNENREPGPFKIYGFRDDGDDTNITVAPTAVLNNVRTFGPVVSLFTRVYDQGPVINAAAPQPYAVFRGTNQPATAFTADKKGVVFFAGTRFNPPLSAFAPLPVPGSPATYPCRSTFDSIIYALQAEQNAAAYDLNGSGDDAYAIFQESRIVGIGMQADPEPGRGGSRFAADEGQRKPGVAEVPPPKPGKPPTGGADVRLGFRADRPMPAMKFGSTVCQ